MNQAHSAEFDAILAQLHDLAQRAGLAFLVLVTSDGENVAAGSNLERPDALELAAEWSRDSVNMATRKLRTEGEQS